MCTAISFHSSHHLFGRNLDLEYRYNEAAVITPRHFPLFESKEHPALIGTATMIDGYPLYYDAMNEHGLCAAALNFTHSAVYNKTSKEKINTPHFEVIPKILCECKNVREAKAFCENLNITNEPFNDSLPISRLHWIVADKYGAFVLESERDGLHIKDAPIGVLTNEPPLEYHLQNLRKYINLSPKPREKNHWGSLEINADSRGMGAIGLPGDCSSESRFVRAAFNVANSYRPECTDESIAQFFHLLGSVEMPAGAVRLGNAIDLTQYSCCYDTDSLIYYYRTYYSCKTYGIKINNMLASGESLEIFPLKFEVEISLIN